MYDNPIWMLINGVADTLQMCDIVDYYQIIDGMNPVINGKPVGTVYPPVLSIVHQLRSDCASYMRDHFSIHYTGSLLPSFQVALMNNKGMNYAVEYLLEMLDDFLEGLRKYDPENFDRFMAYKDRLLSA